MRWCGTYYCYATDGDGVKISISEDLVHWEFKGYAIKEAEKETIGRHRCFIGTEYFICTIPI